MRPYSNGVGSRHWGCGGSYRWQLLKHLHIGYCHRRIYCTVAGVHTLCLAAAPSGCSELHALSCSCYFIYGVLQDNFYNLII